MRHDPCFDGAQTVGLVRKFQQQPLEVRHRFGPRMSLDECAGLEFLRLRKETAVEFKLLVI